MWPLKKSQVKLDIEENKKRAREAMAREEKRRSDECCDFAAPGESFVYLGVRFVCLNNRIISKQYWEYLGNIYLTEPGITAEYRDNRGVIHEKEFPHSMLPVLKAENERQAV